jgi:serine phosphatase RsbU (regulator of sigma subunit)
MATLTVIRGGEIGKLFELGQGEAVLGRSPECDVVLDMAAVSRRHAFIANQNGAYFVRDNESRNGTLVNGQKVLQPSQLRDGDKILICDVELEFRNRAKPGVMAVPEMASSLLGPRMDDDSENYDASNVMATIDVTGGGSRSSWHLSAKPEQQLKAMIEISQNLGNLLKSDDILPKLLDSLFKIFVQADRGFVIMRPKPTAPLTPVAAKARRGDVEGARISKTIVERAINERKAILSADAQADERFQMAQSVSDFHIRSLICAPMFDSNGAPLGVIQVDTRDQRSRFNDFDLQVLASVANQAAISLDNARMHEQAVKQEALQRDLAVAREMQRALLPAASPKIPGYHFFQHYQAAQEVGGDYYDYVLLPDDRFAAVVGDVAGKGVSAAIIMAKLSSDVRFWLAREANPAAAMARINATFSEHGWEDRFVTMVVAVVDPQACELTLVNAGHMPPLLRTTTGEVLEIGGDEAGLPLGVIPDYAYEAYRREFLAGDFLTLFTDGFSEAMNSNRDLFGIERLAQLCSDQCVKPHDLGPCILEKVHEFVGDYPQSDDMCLLCFGRE